MSAFNARQGLSVGTTPTNIIDASGNGTFPSCSISGAAGTIRTFSFKSGTSSRWVFQVNSETESGANVGSSFSLNAIADDGTTPLDNIFTIVRASGGSVNFNSNRPYIFGSVSATDLWVTGGSGGQGKLFYSAADGLNIQAKTGSANDFLIKNPGGTANYIQVSTGSNIPNFPNGLTGALNGSIGNTTPAAGTFNYIKTIGTLTGILPNSTSLDYSTTSRLIATGPDSSTIGTFSLLVASSNMGLIKTGLSVATDGLVTFPNKTTYFCDWGAISRTYSAASVIVGQNIYVEPTDLVSDQVRYINTHASYGHAFTKYVNGAVKFYGKSEAATAAAIVTPNLIGTLDSTGLNIPANTASSTPITGALVVTGGAAFGNNSRVGLDTNAGTSFTINGAAASNRYLALATGSVNRWLLEADSTAEGGSDAGSSFKLIAFNDAATVPDTVLSITRAANGSVAFGATRPITGLSFNGLTGLSSTATDIKMDGIQSAGSTTTGAKADHVHPSDTTRALLAGSASQAFSVSSLNGITVTTANTATLTLGGTGKTFNFGAFGLVFSTSIDSTVTMPGVAASTLLYYTSAPTVGSIPWATAGTGSITYLAPGTAGRVLLSGGAATPTWTTGTLALSSNFATTGSFTTSLTQGANLTLTMPAVATANMVYNTTNPAANNQLAYAATSGSGLVTYLTAPSVYSVLTQTSNAAAPAWTTAMGTGAPVCASVVRELLSAARTYYVRTDGSDSNNGLANTVGGAFLTIQKAVDVVCGTLDVGNYQVTIQVADGAYSGGITLKSVVGATAPIIQGNTTTPASCTISSSTTYCFWMALATTLIPTTWVLKGFTLSTTGTGTDCILLQGTGAGGIQTYNMVYGTCVRYHLNIQGGRLSHMTNYSITGGAQVHAYCSTYGCITTGANTITLTGTPAFSTSFVNLRNFSLYYSQATYSGAATGVQFVITGSSQITTTNQDAPRNYIPGTLNSFSILGGAHYDYIGAEREVLQAARTYYVRTDGNDSNNNGLTNTAGGAFLTIQRAVDEVCSKIDMSIYQVTIQVADGTYTGGVFLKAPIGSLPPIIVGNVTTPANVVVTTATASTYCFAISSTYCASFCTWTIRGIKMTTTGSGVSCVLVGLPSRIQVDNCDFGTCISRHMDAQNGGQIWPITSYAISGPAVVHAFCGAQGEIRAINGITVTITNTPAITRFVDNSNMGLVFYNATTFTGSATGTRYYGNTLSLINTNVGGASYFPGDSVGGTVVNGAVYF